MAVFVTDPYWEERLKAERKASGVDCRDEVWDGVCFMPPLANNEHQGMGFQLALACHASLAGLPGQVFVGANVSDREDGWEHNYRNPDVLVVLPGGRARDCGTHWHGGPDFLIEILSANDRSREKLPFYARISVREVLLIDRDPWQLELYRLQGDELILVGESSLRQPTLLTGEVLPMTFRLVPGRGRPSIEVTHTKDGQQWLV
ncbi:MAG: Uma2 family endonuclease [Gemmataceae bacterium]|nr:Uma2 family endonuclease [Gemmataceae bacterium]